MATLLQNGTVLTGDQLIESDVLIEDSVIVQIGPNLLNTSDDEVVDVQGKYIIPGFIDIHTHGAAGFDFSLGTYNSGTRSFHSDPESFEQGLKSCLDHYIAHGITRVLLTTMAAPISVLKRHFRMLHVFLQYHPEYENLVSGINLEGTFLKDPKYAGAQNPDYFHPPSIDTVRQLQEASGHRLRIVNVPPEHGELGLQLIDYLVKNQIVVAGGHTAAFGDEFMQAVNAGLSLGVHFFNGPSRSSSKGFRMGGAEEIMLRSDQVSLELICDGYHVSPAYVRDTIARKLPPRVIMITDSMFANGMSNLRQFEVLGLKGGVSADGKYLQMLEQEDTLFGSVLSPNDGYANLLTWMSHELLGIWCRKHEALSLAQAMHIASQMASENPANLLGVFHPSRYTSGTASISTGKYADLVVADIRKDDNYSVDVHQVYIRGKKMFQKQAQ